MQSREIRSRPTVGRSGAARRLAVVFMIVAAVMATAPAGVSAAAPDSRLFVDSQAGDHAGGGGQHYLTSSDTSFGASIGNGPHGPIAFLQAYGVMDAGYDIFIGGPAGAPLADGSYSSTRSIALAGPGDPVLDVYRHYGSSCQPTGSFTVLDVAYDGTGTLTKLAANISQHCAGATAGLFLQVRFNSALGMQAVSVAVSGGLTDLNVVAGGSSDPATFSITNTGDGPTTLGAVDETGDTADYPISADDCTGATLATGGACSVTVRFAPRSVGEFGASLIVHNAFPSGSWQFDFDNLGLQVTTTTLQSGGSPVTAPTPVHLVATVSPPPAAWQGTRGNVRFSTRGGLTVLGDVPVGTDGKATLDAAINPGTWGIVAEYEGWYTSTPSKSATLDQVVLVRTRTTLISSLDPALESQPVTLTAAVSADSGTPDAGTLSIMDTTTAAVLGSVDVASSGTTLTVTSRSRSATMT